MCGIFGWQFKKGKTPPRDSMIRVATALGVLNDTRGGLGWGFFSTTARKVFKDTGTIDRHVADLARLRSVMAHTRMPSTGKVSKENSHPFVFDGIVGAHNGVIRNHDSLNKEHGRAFEVDSMHIFAHMSEGKSLNELQGWGAIEFVRDAYPDIICLAKVSVSGDLSIVTTPYGTFWSSNEDHLLTALDAGRIEHSIVEVKPYLEHFVSEGEVFVDASVKHELGFPVTTTYHYSPNSIEEWMGGNESWRSGKNSYQREHEKKTQESLGFTGVVSRQGECTHGKKLSESCEDCKISTTSTNNQVQTMLAQNSKEMEKCKSCGMVVVDDMCLDMNGPDCSGYDEFAKAIEEGRMP